MTGVDALVSEVLRREGWPAYTADPADHGGPTKGGITQRTLGEWRGREVTPEEVAALEEDEARAIYYKVYVADWHFDRIEDPWVCEFVVDTGVLSGQLRAAKMLQRALDVPDDGEVGPVTLHTLGLALQRDAVGLRVELVRQRMHMLLDAMCSDVLKETRQTTNLKWRHGWWNRVCDFLPSIAEAARAAQEGGRAIRVREEDER